MCIGVDELLRHRKPRLKRPYLKGCVCRLGGDGDSVFSSSGDCATFRVRSKSICSGKRPAPWVCFVGLVYHPENLLLYSYPCNRWRLE
jgi:hypothetical protein